MFGPRLKITKAGNGLRARWRHISALDIMLMALVGVGAVQGGAIALGWEDALGMPKVSVPPGVGARCWVLPPSSSSCRGHADGWRPWSS